MNDIRSPLQDLNARRSNNASMDELHKTLETLELKLLELTSSNKNSNETDSLYSESFDDKKSLSDITAELDKKFADMSWLSPVATAKKQNFIAASKFAPSVNLNDELTRIKDSVNILTSENNLAGGNTNDLRQVRETAEHLQEELAALKRMMQTMAREETVRRLNHRWDQFDEKFEAFELQQQQKAAVEFPELNSISDRLDSVRQAIDAMPQMQAVSIQPLEVRLQELALSIENMVGHHNDDALPPLLDERLDEISRAILASSMKRPAPEELRRTEALSQELLTRMAKLSQRIDMLSESSSLPLQQVETLAKQIKVIATYIDRALESGPALELEKVNARLDDIASQLNSVEARFSLPEEMIFSALDQRFDALALRLDEQFSASFSQPDALRNLESQIANIAQHLKDTQQQQPAAHNLAPRLEKVESTILQSREDTLQIARQAAEAAMEKFAAQAPHYESQLVQELAEDMRALEELARVNNERSEKNFESVHTTLWKVVERLSALEARHNHENTYEKKAVTNTAQPLVSEVKTSEAISADLSDVSAQKTTQPAVANQSQMTDVNAIMKRVRGETSIASSLQQQNAHKNNALTAARSAAQSAAKAAERINAAEPTVKTSEKKTFTQLIARQRKPIFLGIGAIMIAFAALQGGQLYFDQPVNAPIEELTQKESSLEDLSKNAELANMDDLPNSIITPVSSAETDAEESLIQNAADAAPEVTTAAIIQSAQPVPEAPEKVSDTFALTEQSLPEIITEAGPDALRQAATDGDPLALFEIGNRYTDGIGTQSDLTKAAQFYEAAANRGFAPAQYRYGNFSEKGLGLPRNIAQAKYWYLQAAEKGNASAMHNLAVLYATGGDSAPDNLSAIKWFEKAAERNIKDSQYNLGILYAQGVATPPDLAESYKWFALAAQSGDQDAADKRDQIAKALSADKLKQAQNTVALWKPKVLDDSANTVIIPDSWMDEMPLQTASVDMKKAVRNIQLILQKNGYDIGSPDGLMGEKTRNAIKKFQSANNEEPTGEINPQLVKLLLDHNK